MVAAQLPRSWRSWGAGATPSQTKVRDARAAQAAAAAAAAAAKAQPAQQGGDWQTAMKNQQSADRMRTAAMGTRTAANWGHNATGGPSNPRAAAAYSDYARAVQQAQQQARASGQDPWMAQQMVDRSKYRTKYGFSSFAKGGKVAKKPAPRRKPTEFQQRQEVQERFQNERMTSAGNTARDRAARQMNVRGDPSINSTAYRDPYLRPAAAPRAAPAPARPAAPGPRLPGTAPVPPPKPVLTPDDGRMPQVDTMGNPVGANYPPGFDTAAEASAAIRARPRLGAHPAEAGRVTA